MREGKECDCVRDASFRKCRRCQKHGKPCLKIPLQVRRRAAAFAATAPADRDKEACKLFNEELKVVTGFLEDQEVPHLLRSLNRNIFRLLGVVSAVAGLPVPAPEEEIELEMYEGAVDDK
ncbi:hypothetical protein GB937_006177 [Aspergillus fischeri]|nr:hypothetical protein GB937_006177 [Aspergillus fischeri]